MIDISRMLEEEFKTRTNFAWPSEEGWLLSNETEESQNKLIRNIVNPAKKDVYIYTDNPKVFFETNIMSAIENAFYNGAKIYFVTYGKENPEEHVSSDYEQKRWNKLREFADVRHAAGIKNESREDVVIADNDTYVQKKTGFPRKSEYDSSPVKSSFYKATMQKIVEKVGGEIPANLREERITAEAYQEKRAIELIQRKQFNALQKYQPDFKMYPEDFVANYEEICTQQTQKGKRRAIRNGILTAAIGTMALGLGYGSYALATEKAPDPQTQSDNYGWAFMHGLFAVYALGGAAYTGERTKEHLAHSKIMQPATPIKIAEKKVKIRTGGNCMEKA